MFLWGWGGGIDPNFILSVFTSDQVGMLERPRLLQPAV